MGLRDHTHVRDHEGRAAHRQLNFSGPHIDAKYVEQVTDYVIQNPTVVINPHTTPAYVDEPPSNIIPPWSSTILKDTRIKQAQGLILLEMRESTNPGDIILEPGWDLYGNIVGKTPAPASNGDLPYPKNTPLWRSPQDSIGLIEFDPSVFLKQPAFLKGNVSFEIKVNLWFAPEHTHCFIHNKHDFLEIHAQVSGHGRMQKFKAQDYGTLYEDLHMGTGYTTSVPFCSIQAGPQFIYPWHQYYADTDCVWLAIEYHPAGTHHRS
jgi:hypothetical protein